MSTLPREFRDASLIRHVVEARMPDEATSAIEAGIRSAFTAYSRDDDPDWRSATWVKAEECSRTTCRGFACSAFRRDRSKKNSKRCSSKANEETPQNLRADSE